MPNLKGSETSFIFIIFNLKLHFHTTQSYSCSLGHVKFNKYYSWVGVLSDWNSRVQSLQESSPAFSHDSKAFPLQDLWLLLNREANFYYEQKYIKCFLFPSHCGSMKDIAKNGMLAIKFSVWNGLMGGPPIELFKLEHGYSWGLGF